MSPILQLQGVTKRYGNPPFSALNGVDLTIEAGEFVALMGPSGCGKSTLLNLMGAIDGPTEGALLFDGINLPQLNDDALTRLRRTRMGYIFQFFNLLNHLTVAENVALPLEMGRAMPERAIQARVRELLAQVHLEHRAAFYPAQLSGGEMQRVAIARALANAPQLLLADEPTGNLDTENGRQILTLLQKLHQEAGHTVIMATHSEEAAQYAQRVLRMQDGRILSEERPAVSTGQHA